MTDTTFYKVTAPGGVARNGGTGTWHLPKGKRPGKWMNTVPRVIPCYSGYHLVTIDQLISWLGPEIWVAEGRGEHVDHGDKHVFAQARLLRKTAWGECSARLFAADCAEHVLHIYEEQVLGDDRPRKAIEAARRFARGEITADELYAAWAAAWGAARAAAWAAARAAARDAAWAAARAAARDAAWGAERQWQTARLTQYLDGEIR